MHISEALLLEFSDCILKSKGHSATLKYIISSLKHNPSINTINKFLCLIETNVDVEVREDFSELLFVTKEMAENDHRYTCKNCGFSGENMEWKCPGCHNWETISLMG